MAFAEVRIDEGLIVYQTTGGEGYKTNIVTVQSGLENRNSLWVNPKGAWDLGQRAMPPQDLLFIRDFFHARGGSFEGFRFKDLIDYKATSTPTFGRGNNTYSQGVLSGITPGVPTASNTGSGYPTLQLGKAYTSGTSTRYRMVQKPVTGTLKAYRNGVLMVAGVGAGNYSMDFTTGIMTVVATASSAATSISVGASTLVTLTTNPSLSIGQKIYLTGFTGADASLLNLKAHTISNITGAGPFVFTLSTNTTGKTITLGTGTGYNYPQSADIFTAGFEFDVPVRFALDELKVTLNAAIVQTPGVVEDVLTFLPPTPIIEIRV